MKHLLFFLLAFPFLASAQILEKQFVATVQYNGFTQINDSLYRGDLIEFRDVLIEGYQPSGVDSGFICLDGTGRAYRVEVVNSFDYSSINVDLIELDDYDEIPIGVGIVAERYGSTYQIPNGLVNSIGISAVLQAKILNHNTKIAATTVQPPDTLYLQELSGTTAISNGDTIPLIDYVRVVDTPAMLLNYPSTAGYGIIDGGKTWRADTTSPNGLATRLFAKTLPTSIAADRLVRSNGSNLVAGNLSDNGTKLQALLPWQFQTYTTAGLPTGVTGYTVYNTTIGGTGWYDGTRWNYVPKSDRSAFTSTYIPFTNSSGQLTEASTTGQNLRYYYTSGIHLFEASSGIIARGVTGINSGNADLAVISAGGQQWNFSVNSSSGAFSFFDGTFTQTPFTIVANAGSNRFRIQSTTTDLVASSLVTSTVGSSIQSVGASTDALGSSGQWRVINGSNIVSFSPASTSPYFAITNGSQRGYIQATSLDGFRVGSNSNHPLVFLTNGTVRGQFSTSGFLGIGTTTPLQELDVNGDAYIRDSTRLATTPAHSAITGLLARDANGWVGLASLAGGLSYSGGVLTGANIYNTDGDIPSGTTRRIGLPTTSNGYKEFYGEPGWASESFISSVNNFYNSASHQLASLYGSLRSRHSYLANYNGSGIKITTTYTQEANKASQAKGTFKQDMTFGNTAGAVFENRAYSEISMDSTSNTFINLNFSKFDNTSGSGRGHYVGIAKGSQSGVSSYNYNYATTSYAVNTSFFNSSVVQFPWLLIDNLDTDTTSNRISFYNRKYPWTNSRPGTGSNVHVWDNGTPSFKEIKRDTTIYVDDADYDFSTALEADATTVTTTEISRRYNRVIFWMTTTGAAGSDSEITLHTPDVNLMQVEYVIHSVDEAGGFSNKIVFGTNNAVDSTNGLVTNYYPSAGQGVHIRAGLRSAVYKYRYSN